MAGIAGPGSGSRDPEDASLPCDFSQRDKRSFADCHHCANDYSDSQLSYPRAAPVSGEVWTSGIRPIARSGSDKTAKTYRNCVIKHRPGPIEYANRDVQPPITRLRCLSHPKVIAAKCENLSKMQYQAPAPPRISPSESVIIHGTWSQSSNSARIRE